MKKTLLALSVIFLFAQISTAQVYKQTWKQMYDTLTGQATFYAVVNFYIGVTTNPADCYVALLGTGTVRAKEGYFDSITCPVNSFDLECRLSTNTITRMLTEGTLGQVWQVFTTSPSWGTLSGLGIDLECRVSTGTLLIRIDQMQIDTTTLANFIYQLKIDTASLEDVKFSRFGGDIQGNTYFSTGTIVTIWNTANDKFMQFQCFDDGETRITASNGDVVFSAFGDIKFNWSDLLDITNVFADNVYAANIQIATATLRQMILDVAKSTGTFTSVMIATTSLQNQLNQVAIDTSTLASQTLSNTNSITQIKIDTGTLESQISAENLWDRVDVSTRDYVRLHTNGDDIRPNGSSNLGASDDKFNNLWLAGNSNVAGAVVIGTNTVGGYALELYDDIRFSSLVNIPYKIVGYTGDYLSFGSVAFQPSYWHIKGRNAADMDMAFGGKWAGGYGDDKDAFKIQWTKDSGNANYSIAYMPQLISAYYLNGLTVSIPDIGSATEPWNNLYLTSSVYADNGYIGNIQEATTTLKAQSDAIAKSTGAFTSVSIATTSLQEQINAISISSGSQQAIIDQIRIDTATLAAAITENTNEINQIKIDTATLAEIIDNVESDILQLKIDTGTMESQIDLIKSDILQINIDTGTIEAKDIQQDARLNQLQIDTTTLKNIAFQLGIDTATLRSILNQVILDTASLQGAINELTNIQNQIIIDTGTLEVRIDNAESNILQLSIDSATIQSILNQIRLDTATLQGICNQLKIDTETLAGIQAQIRLDTATLQGLVSNLTSRMNQVQIDTTTLQSQATSNTDRINQLQIDTTTLKSILDAVKIGTATLADICNQLKIDTGTLAGLLTNLTNTVNQIQIDTSTLASTDLTQTNRLNQMQIDTTTIAAVNTTQDNRLNQIQIDTVALAAVNTTQNNRLNQIQIDTATLAAANTTQDGRINQIQIDTTTLAGQVSTLNAIGYSSQTIAVIFGSTDATAGNLVDLTADIPITYNMTFKGWCVDDNLSLTGNCQISISSRAWGQNYGRIDGTDIPRLAGQSSSSSTALSGWTTTAGAGGCLRVRITSASTVKQITLGLSVWKPRE